MSQETLEWLNEFTLVGFTTKRGNAWHYRQGSDNHYPLAVPVGDVLTRLFDWEAVKAPLYVHAGVDKYTMVPGRVAVRRNDTGHVLGVFKDGYEPHQYREWLLQNVANILDDELGIGSAGLLRGGAQAWVSVEVPENITTPSGVEFRPNLLACTSFDGSLATTYKRVVQNVVCDNTLTAGLSEGGQVLRVKHTRYSQLRVKDAREALAIVSSMADDFEREVEELCAAKVTTRQFDAVLDALVPLPEEKGRSLTVAREKRDDLRALYLSDARCAPWTGSKFGVLQAFNTYQHHFGTVRNMGRVERNMSNAITGATATVDLRVLAALAAA